MPRPKEGLTNRRRAFLEAVAACRTDGVPATVSHIQPRLESFGASVPHLSSLNLLAQYALDEGFVRLVGGGGKRGGGERVFLLAGEGEKVLGLEPLALPALKSPVCAGTPASVGDIETRPVERLDEVISFNAKSDLLVPICGDSMNRAGILDGDQILVRRLPDGERPPNGAVVVGWMSQGEESEWTVKYFVSNGRVGEESAFLLFPSSWNNRHRPFLICINGLNDEDLEFARDARRAHPGWDWLDADLQVQDCVRLTPEMVGMHWTWTRGLIRGALS